MVLIMHIYHATYASKVDFQRETVGIKASDLDEAYLEAVKFLPEMRIKMDGAVELDGIMKGVKAI